MNDSEKIDFLRTKLDEFWGALGQLVLEDNPDLKVVEKVCNEIGEALNDTDVKLEGVTGHLKGLYATYQPLDVLKYIAKRNK